MLGQDSLLGGRYRVEDLLARGGMADVYRGIDDVAGTTVAVKVLRHMTAEQGHRFATEARMLERLDHPAIVRFCESGEDGGVPYLVMEFVDGPTLAELVAQGPVPVERAAAMGSRLADALAHAHHLGIVHRDVKPGNVLIGSDGEARLADFGIARLTDATTLTQTGWLVGTASYLAPEQLDGRHVGPKADIYSLGLVLLEATTGRRVYDGSPTEAAMARLVRQPDIPAELPAWWSALIRDMTALGPDFRPSAAEVVERLDGVRAADPTTVLPTSRASTATQTLRLPPVEVGAPPESAGSSAGSSARSSAGSSAGSWAGSSAGSSAGEATSDGRGRSWVPLALIAGAVAAMVVLGLFLDRIGDGGTPPAADAPELAPALGEALERLEQEVGG